MTIRDPETILASASPQRSALLARTAVPFEVRVCPLREPAPPPDVSPRVWAEAMAYFKARAVAEDCPGRWVLGADTVVACAGELLGKAADEADARRMLELQGRNPAQVSTGVSFVRIDGGVSRRLRTAVTRVEMRDDPAEREAYIRTGDWRDKAGAYGIQNVGDRLVTRIDGSFSNVVGLPLELVEGMARDVGLTGAAGDSAASETRSGFEGVSTVE